MTKLFPRALQVALVGFGLFAVQAYTSAQAADDFFKGKTVTVGIGTDVGGSHDLNGRLVAAHLGRHIPGNPTLVPQNVPGANSMTLANFLAQSAPKDGTYIAGFNRSGVMAKLYDPTANVSFDPLTFNWLGSPDKIWSVAYARSDAKVKTADDLLKTELIVGASNGLSDRVPNLMASFAGFKFKVVSGYKGGADVNMAVDRGEVEGRASTTWAELKNTTWLRDKKINLLFWNGLEVHPDEPKVPLGLDYIKNPDDRRVMELFFAVDEMGYPFAAAPGTPADRVTILRKAFADMLADPAYIADANKLSFDVHPVTAERMTKIVRDSFDAPKAIVDRVREAIK
jgi:tripartite-type tricarboxylate transporter receptor subunit TctC